MKANLYEVHAGETDWIIAENEEQVFEAFSGLYGTTREEFENDLTVKKLSDEEINNLTFRTNEDPQNPEESKPARQIMNEYICEQNIKTKGKDIFPYFLASTCFQGQP